MRIYFFIQDMSLTGGTERVCQNLSRLFVLKGHKVTVVSYNKTKDIETYKPIKDVRVVYLSNERYPIDKGLFARMNSIWLSVSNLKSFYKEEGICKEDVIISQNFFSNMILWIAGKSRWAIGCEHFKYDLYPKPVRALRCIVYSHFRYIVTLTDKDKKRFAVHLSSNKLFTIPNMVVIDGEIEMDKNSHIIIAVGRLHRQKGFDFLIDAMKPVAKKYPDWKLYIFGEGELKEKLQCQIDRAKLSKNIFMKGFSHNIKSEFEKSSFFVLSSRYEGYPMVLLEAMSLGVPSVAFDCPEGPSELLSTGGGILVEKENVRKLSDAIIYMIEHPEFREKCMNHKEYIREHLSPEVIYKKWMELFKLRS